MATEKSLMAVIRAARLKFRNDCDKVAFIVHACFLASGHVLNATCPSAKTAFSSTSTDEVGIDHWNELEDSYMFVYINSEKDSKKVLVKCLVMKDTLLVSVLLDGASEPVHLEIKIGDYIGANGGNYSDQFKNLDKLVQSINTEIISKLYGVSKPTSLERGEGSRRNVSEPDFEFCDPQGPQPFSSGMLIPPNNPNHGSNIVPGSGGGMYPRRGVFGGDGRFVRPAMFFLNWFEISLSQLLTDFYHVDIGLNDPRWFGGDGGPGFPGANPLVPPGARFNPYGPPGIPGFEPNRFGSNPSRRLDGTHPDLEHRPDDSDFV